jgi:outer membrane protein assembly factor BamB
VIDFGIAHAADAAIVTATGSATGSPGFIAPEQARGEATGPAADVFSLGAVLVHAATGEGPYGQGPPHLLIYRVVHEPPRLDRVTDPVLGPLAAACLAARPGGRPTPAQLLERLAPHVPQGTDLNGVGWLPRPVAAGIAQAATAPPVPALAGTRTLRPAPTRRKVLALGGAGAATVAAATVAGVLLWPEDERPAAAPTRARAATGASAPPPPVTVDEPVWRRNTGAEYLSSTPAVSGGTVFVGSERGRLLALDARTGRPRWTYTAGSPIRERVAVAGGVVYMGEFDGGVHAIDARTGQARWRYQAVNGGTDIFHARGLVYGGRDPLYALDAGTGAVRWSRPGGGHLVVAGGVACVEGEKGLTVLDAATGRPRWTYRLEEGTGSPALAGGVVYFGDFQGQRLHAVDLRTGRRRWSYDLGATISARPVIANGVVYFGDYNRNVFALDASTGTLRWQVTVEGEVRFEGVWADGLLYLTAGAYGNGTVYALDAATGRVVWRFEAPGGLEAAPAVGGGMVYASCKDGYLYALRARPGSN